MVLCGVGFWEAWQGVQGAKKRPPAGESHQRPDAPLAHLDLAIPRRVASQQSTRIHVVAARLHRPFLPQEEVALADAKGQSEFSNGLGPRYRASN
jgi:hypothetical protein